MSQPGLGPGFFMSGIQAMDRLTRLKKLAASLEIAVLVLAVAALVFRATLYWQLPAADGEPYGTGDVLDLALALVLFVVCSLCAVTGVAISILGDRADKRFAYQAFFIGVLSFVAYDWLYPHVPRLL
jgi:hypothetical protein